MGQTSAIKDRLKIDLQQVAMERARLVHRGLKALLLVFVAVALIGIAVDVKNTRKYGQIDLRNRVVGARLMLEGKDPYTHNWQTGDSPQLLDPLSPQTSPITKTTVTPAVLAFHASFSALGYGPQKQLWLAIQWFLYSAIVLIAFSLTKDRVCRALIVGVGLAFSCSAFWRQHIEVGQIPILYGFMATVYIAGLKRRGWVTEIANGAGLGLLVSFRPQFVFLGLPLLVYGRGRQVVGSVLGVALGLAIPTALSPKIWGQYVETIKRYLWPAESGVVFPAPVFPQEIEGLTNITGHAPYSDLDSSAAGVFRLFGWHVSTQIFFGLIVLVAVWWCVRLYRENKAGAPLEYASAVMLGLVLLTDLFLPIRRLPYSDAILIPIVLLLIATAGRPLVDSTRNLWLIFVAIIFALELRWALLSGLVPCAAIAALEILVRWRGDNTPRCAVSGGATT